ncbi:cupin domain-containing protein [Haladaptatus salinisoli]|uniref:cupin domain-containing protein n=1 Tax=Haladaptatus salinisoli TaxID=2884876 RepID=UPI001D0BA9D0|nr:cupin domain-containing protein [Haladaptatus salinisoli]
MSGDIRVVDPADVDRTAPVAGLVERTAFHVGDYRLVLFRIDENSSWHVREGAIYGWVRAGHGRIAHGGERATDLGAGDFLSVPPATVHRYVAGRDRLEILAVVTGDPDVTRVAAPTTADEDAVPTIVGPDDLVPTVESPNLIRETPFPGAEVLPMRVRAAGGAAAGWHHHGDNVYFGYAVDGPSETEYGPAGEKSSRIEIGECFHVPPRLIHRDTNPTDTAHTGIIWLCGGEPWVVNVEGPE